VLTTYTDVLLASSSLPGDLCRLVASYVVRPLEKLYEQVHEPRQVARCGLEVSRSSPLTGTLCRLVGWYAWDKALLLPGDLLDCEDGGHRVYLSIVQGGNAWDNRLMVHYLGWSSSWDVVLDDVSASRCFPPLLRTGPVPCQDEFVCASDDLALRARLVVPSGRYAFYAGEAETLYYAAISEACKTTPFYWQLRRQLPPTGVINYPPDLGRGGRVE
jgi:hypothetical protein